MANLKYQIFLHHQYFINCIIILFLFFFLVTVTVTTVAAFTLFLFRIAVAAIFRQKQASKQNRDEFSDAFLPAPVFFPHKY